MARRRTRAVINDYMAWNALALRWMETLAASQQVIAHRTRRSNTPVQLVEMVEEKTVAGLKASQAMATHFTRLGVVGTPAMFGAWVRMMSSGLAPYHAAATRNARRSRRNTL